MATADLTSEATDLTSMDVRPGWARSSEPGDDEPRPAFASTVHDPNGCLLEAIEERGDALVWYRRAYVCVTEETDSRVVAVLKARGATLDSLPAGVAGRARLRSLRLAVEDGHGSVLYVDLDRWLHWVETFPEELQTLPARIAAEAPEAWYVCLGRTARAFATHPEVQQVAEGVTNRAFERATGRRIDATAGGCWLTAAGAAHVVARSTEPTMGTDLEWPALVWRCEPDRLAVIEVEGLEFESAGFAGGAIAAAGGEEEWLAHTYQTPEMWRQRLQLTADSVAALARVLGR